jgi:hypothetical protein
VAPQAGAPLTHYLFGVSLASVSQLPDAVSLSSTLERRLDIVDVYSGWISGFPTASVQAVAATGAVPEITWEPWNNNLGPAANPFPLSEIASGSFDEYIAQFASAAAEWKGPLYLRLAQEMNGNWYPWDVGVNGNTDAEYVAAWRHVYGLFQAAGATNVSWIWSPNVMWKAGTDPSASYPGADVVNVIGLDGYNAGTAVAGGTWQSPAQVFGPTLAAVEALAPGKPVFITETGCSESGGSKAAWIGQLFALLATDPRVEGLVWSEYVGRADWPVETSTTAVDAMRSALAQYWSS